MGLTDADRILHASELLVIHIRGWRGYRYGSGVVKAYQEDCGCVAAPHGIASGHELLWAWHMEKIGTDHPNIRLTLTLYTSNIADAIETDSNKTSLTDTLDDLHQYPCLSNSFSVHFHSSSASPIF